jgi:Fic family protein
VNRSGLCHQVRQALKRLPPPFANHYGVVPLPPPAASPTFTSVMREVQTASASLARLETLTSELGDPWLVSRILMRREAVSSSAIEGTNSTLDELLAVEETGDLQALEAARQVKDYALCLDAAVPQATSLGLSVFTRELISELHRAVMQSETAYPGTPGEPRTRVVWIGGRGDIAYSTYNPTPPEDIGRCLADTIAYMRGDADELWPPHIIVRMAVAHAHFEAVHPFADGNGRVGRLLLPLMMAAQGHAPLYLSPYIEAHRSAYYAALEAAQQRLLWHEIIGFVADAVTGSVAELLATRRALQDLRAIWLSRRKFRSGSAALRALDVLPHYPVMTTRRLAALLDVSAAQAGQAVRQLMEAGILIERTGYRRNRLFAAAEALSIINRPFGDDPILPAPGNSGRYQSAPRSA